MFIGLYKMKNKYLIGILFIIISLWIIITFTVSKVNDVDKYSKNDIAKISHSLSDLQDELDNYSQEIISGINKKGIKNFLVDDSKYWNKLLNGKMLAISLIKNNKLIYWTNNDFLDYNINNIDSVYKLYFYNNSWVLARKTEVDTYSLCSYIVIKKDYSINNQFLTPYFNPKLDIPNYFTVSNTPTPEAYAVTDLNNEFIMSVFPDREHKMELPESLYVYWLFIFILLGLFIYEFFKSLPQKKKQISFYLLLLFLIVVRMLMQVFHLPDSLYQLPLFSPVFYSASVIFPSLGDIIVSSFFLFFLVLVFHRKSFPLRISSLNIAIVYIAFIFLLSEVLSWVFQSMIYHSGINLEIFNILEIDYHSILIILVFTLLGSSFLLIIDKVTRNLMSYGIFGLKHLIASISAYLLYRIIAYFAWGHNDVIFYIFFILLITALILVYYFRNIKWYSNTFIFILLFSVFISTYVTWHSNKKNTQVKKALIVGLSAERDIMAESQLEDISNRIQLDYILQDLSQKPYENQERVYNYLKDNYIFGFWSKYDLQTTLCGRYDNLKLDGTEKLYRCFDYFSELISKDGLQVPESRFFFVESESGKASYLGAFEYKKQGDTLKNRLFIELIPKHSSHALGFPDVLVDNKIRKSKKMDKYSYAFYRNRSLINSSGQYLYQLNSQKFEINNYEFNEVKEGNTMHLIYRPNAQNLIVLSSQRMGILYYITTFAYLFSFFSLLYVIYYFIYLIFTRKIRSIINIKQRIRIAFLVVFFTAFIVTGIITVNYMISIYHNKHSEIISEKLQSIIIELSQKLGNEQYLKYSDKEVVASLLIRCSNLFFTDIHIYDKNGSIYATSRNDIFSKGIQGKLMNSQAYRELFYFKNSEYIHNERIGTLKYISGYIPFFNNNGNLIAFINVPYFTKQTELTKEISDFVVTFLNLYLLLFVLGIWLTVWLSESLTRPLAMLQKKLKKVSLGSQNEPIQYKRMDEIGSLVYEYNRMLEELAQSAQLLAESEREMAWREMARQIAHEIKNPLTPMKLNIQHLQRAYQEKSPDWEKLLDKVFISLIEQIDSLSHIASEFSTFARMPLPNMKKVNVVEVMHSIISLYSSAKDVELRWDFNNNSEVWALADSEQLLRVFNNLIKNAIQAIPPDRKGLIKIELITYPSEVLIKVSDNGTGIPIAIQDKLFTPNFTTKTSGMGLGLAIVRKIIESLNGTVRFVTDPNSGTTFFIEIPTYHEDDNTSNRS